MASVLENKRLLVLGGAAVVLAGVVAFTFMSGGSSSPEPHHAVVKKPVARPAAAPATAASSPSDAAPGVPGDTGDEDVFERKRYVYQSVGRTDPFQSLVTLAMSQTGSAELDPNALTLVGVLEKGGERRALVEDGRGYGYVLRKGDRVLRGKVTRVGPDFVSFKHSVYGVSETRTLKLDGLRKGELGDGSIR